MFRTVLGDGLVSSSLIACAILSFLIGNIVLGLAAPAAEIKGAVAKADRPATQQPAVACSQTWPYYERACLRDDRQAPSTAMIVRIVSTDRLPDGAVRANR